LDGQIDPFFIGGGRIPEKEIERSVGGKTVKIEKAPIEIAFEYRRRVFP
jgi:hypothetical protein